MVEGDGRNTEHIYIYLAEGGAGPAGPMVDEVLAADGPAAQAAAQPPEVMALLQQGLASNQAIVASTQAIAARITAIEIARTAAPAGLQYLPMAA